MTITAVTPLPAISRTDPDFKAKVNLYWLTQVPAWTTANNAQALQVQAKAEEVEAARAAAAASATTASGHVTAAIGQVTLATAEKTAAASYAALAATYAGAPRWTPGAYADGDVRWSPVNRRLYRCTAAVSGSTDPSADLTKWVLLGYSVAVAMAANNIDCSLADYFTKTIAANTTLTISNVPPAPARWVGLVEVNHTGGNITLPAGSYWVDGLVPTFYTGKTHLLMVSTRNGGTSLRWSALPNFAG